MSERDEIVSSSPNETFLLGEKLGESLNGGEVLLLTGGLGAGKTLLTKGILSGLDYDVDEVTSPSFTLVNLYETPRFNVYHIDLWRSEPEFARFSVGLDEILEDDTAVVIVEWAERLGEISFDRPAMRIGITGEGDEPRRISVTSLELDPSASV